MLKIKFWRVDNILLMKVLEQGDEIKRGNFRFEASNGIIIESLETPSLASISLSTGRRLCISGRFTKADNSVVVNQFTSEKIAKESLNLYLEAIKEYNKSLPCRERDDKDIEVIVAE